MQPCSKASTRRTGASGGRLRFAPFFARFPHPLLRANRVAIEVAQIVHGLGLKFDPGLQLVPFADQTLMDDVDPRIVLNRRMLANLGPQETGRQARGSDR